MEYVRLSQFFDKEKEMRESSPTKLLKGRKQKRWTTSAVFLSELKEKRKELQVLNGVSSDEAIPT